MEKEKLKEETLNFCRKMCGQSIKLFLRNLVAEGLPKDKLANALKKTETELNVIVISINEECRQGREEEDALYVNIRAKRKDYLTRILVHYLKESESLTNAVYFPRQSFGIFAEAVRKLLGEIIIEEKQIQCYAVVNDYRDKGGHIDWDSVYVDSRAKQIAWDVFFRISSAISGLSGDWFKDYIADYAKTHGGFYGEGMAHYVQERLESIAKMF